MLISKAVLFNLISLFILLPAFASTTFSVKKEIPRFSSPVIDELGWLSKTERNYLSHRLDSFYKAHQVQIAVFITDSLEGEVLEQYSLAVAESWKLGNKDTDKGLLFLFAAKERKIRIEVGQGLEGDIPDALAANIINQVITPAFRKALYIEGIDKATSIVINRIAPDFNAPVKYKAKRKKAEGSIWEVLLTIIFMIAIFSMMGRGPDGKFSMAVLMLSLLSGRSSSRGGFGGGGGFSGGGGGGFSGGGASGGW